jgi:hypothetical protein
LPWRCSLDDQSRGASPTGDPGSAQPTGPRSDEAAGGTSSSPSAQPKPPKVPSLRQQLGATRASFVRLIQAHLALAKAEFAEIGAEIKRFAAAGGIAFVAALFVAILIPVGSALFVGEWLFGSIGWGVLVFSALAVAIAVTVVLSVVGATGRQIVGSILLGLVVGVFVGIVLGLDLTNQAWSRLGDQILPNIDPAVRPLVTAVVIMAPIVALIGLILGIRSGGASGAIGGLIGGALVGALLGALTAARWGPNAGAGMGTTVGLVVWSATLVALVMRHGIDSDAIRARLTPSVTMETTRETIEWVRKQTPLGPKS